MISTHSLLHPGGELGAPASGGARDWRILGYFNIYRTLLACLLTLLLIWGVIPRALGVIDIPVFRWAAFSYLAFGIASMIFIRGRFAAYSLQLMVAVVVDVVALSLMMHASGGVTSGFGMLLIVAVAGGSIIAGSRRAFLFAAAATLAVLLQQLIPLRYPVYTGDYTHAGLLGGVFFCSAALAHVAAQRIRASEALAAKRGVDLANLAQLNEHIIHRMQSGILALDADRGVVMSNESARTLLGLSTTVENRSLATLCKPLDELYDNWRGDRDRSTYTFMSTVVQVEVTASFAGLGPMGAEGALV